MWRGLRLNIHDGFHCVWCDAHFEPQNYEAFKFTEPGVVAFLHYCKACDRFTVTKQDGEGNIREVRKVL
jgi:hypothetical protein